MAAIIGSQSSRKSSVGDKELEANQRAVSLSAVASIISSDEYEDMSVNLTNVDYVVQLKLAIASC